MWANDALTKGVVLKETQSGDLAGRPIKSRFPTFPRDASVAKSISRLTLDVSCCSYLRMAGASGQTPPTQKKKKVKKGEKARDEPEHQRGPGRRRASENQHPFRGTTRKSGPQPEEQTEEVPSTRTEHRKSSGPLEHQEGGVGEVGGPHTGCCCCCCRGRMLAVTQLAATIRKELLEMADQRR